MKKLLPLGVLLFLIGITTATLSSQGHGGSEGIQSQFVAAWRLASLEQEVADAIA
jgi:hypothetical protein